MATESILPVTPLIQLAMQSMDLVVVTCILQEFLLASIQLARMG